MNDPRSIRTSRTDPVARTRRPSRIRRTFGTRCVVPVFRTHPAAGALGLLGCFVLASSLSWPAAAAGHAGPQAEQATRTKHLEAEAAVEGRTVRVDATASSLEISVGSGDTLRVVADLEYWSNETEWMEAVDQEFELGVQETAMRIEIAPTDLPELGRQGWFERLFHSRRISYDLTLTLVVPEGTPLEVENRYGDVTVEGVRGPLDVGNTSGSVVVSGTRGETRLVNRYGDLAVEAVDGPLETDVSSGRVEVAGISGDAVVRGQYGDVTVRDVGGRLELRSGSADIVVQQVGPARVTGSYGTVEIRGVAGPLDVDVTSGDLTVSGVDGRLDASSNYATVEVEDVQGELVYQGASVSGSFRRIGGAADVMGSYGDLVLEEIGGTLRVKNTSGGITVAGAGPAELEGSYAPIRVEGIRGALRVTASSAAVIARAVTGAVDVSTSYDSVRLDGVGGAVTVVNQSGRVEVAGLTGDALGASHRIETSYADVEVEWPASAELQYRLVCTYGNVSGDLPGTPQERGSRQVLEGSTSAGAAARLDVSVQSGSITVRRR